MKLTKKDIGGLFDVNGGDGSYILRLCGIKKGVLLFYSYGSDYYCIDSAKASDYRRYNPEQWEDEWTKRGWKNYKYDCRKGE